MGCVITRSSKPRRSHPTACNLVLTPIRRNPELTGVPCESLSLAATQGLTAEGNGMEEVVGSIPTRSTNKSCFQFLVSSPANSQ